MGLIIGYTIIRYTTEEEISEFVDITIETIQK